MTILYKIKAAMNEVRNNASNGIEKETTSKSTTILSKSYSRAHM